MTEWQPTSRSCFVCGRENPLSLGLRWSNHPETGEIRGRVTIPEQFNGFPGVAHGGVVAAILDETAGRTVLLDGGFDDLMVTLKMEVLFRRPTPTGTPLEVVGRLLNRSPDRAEAKAEMRLPNGFVTAEVKVILATPPESISSRWEQEREHWRVSPP
jgi:acyl-coenzyme A thioesterase PaaI-like protein